MAAITNRYARAFADAVFDMKADPDAVVSELKGMLALMQESLPLQRIWENPSIPADQKRHLLDALASRANFSKVVRNFTAVLIDHRRIEQLAEITREVESELDARLGFAEAEITSARELSDSEKHALEGRVSTMTGKKVRARYAVDHKLLGGAIVRLGSTIYDGSVKGQLQRMKEQLVAE